MKINARPATNQDIPTVKAMLAHGMQGKHYRGDLAWDETSTDDESLSAIIEAGNLYIAEGPHGPVGTFMLFWEDPARWGQQPPIAGYLHRFVVGPGLRGQHVGDQILDLAAQEVANHGKQYLRLTCPAGNHRLQAYHLAHGFTRADSKATAQHTTTPIVYFERAVVDTPEQQTQPTRRSFAQRLRQILLHAEE